MKKIAMVLSGCGNKDGTEITEAVALIVGLSQAGADLSFFAPDYDFTAKNFLTNNDLQVRNCMVEAARITRSNMRPLSQLSANEFDALVLPGGYGAALHLSNWAEKGSDCEVLSDLAEAIKDFHQQSKPIAAVCIAPVLLARVLGHQGITVTIGNDAKTIDEIRKTGAYHESCPVDDFITDRGHKIISTPAYMYDAKAHEVFMGISKLAKELMEMA